MDPARFSRIKELFLEAQGVPSEKRADFLLRVCGDDADLKREIETLLAQESRSLDVLNGGESAALEAESRPLPEKIGPYRILGLLGEGGMGAVYLALQETPIHRKVALKSIRAGFESPLVRARFESERQALALMDHPNIARVLDAGSDENGHPYFVMELIQGVAITRYAREHDLPLRERLHLFLQVCRAIEDAHRKGIIHRDLKPSNILVVAHGDRAEVRIIDFGVAKATEMAMGHLPDSPLTQEGRLIGTIDYMSPEQTTGLPGQGDIRSDVYSLGIVLYELLANEPPYRVAALPLVDAIRIITTETPRPISRTPGGGARLPEDLSIIVRKALEKDPARRYGTAGQFADDLDRFLRSEPILARPPSAGYQLRMLARRHKGTVVFLSTVAMLLLAFGVIMTYEAGVQRRERLHAEKEAQKAERMNAFLQSMFRSVNPGEKHVDVQVRDVLDDAARGLDFGTMPDPEIEGAMRRTLGNTYLDLGEYGKAKEELTRALALRRRALSPRDPLVAESLYDLAAFHLSNGAEPAGLAVADSLCREALAIRRRTFGEDGTEVASSLEQLAEIQHLRYALSSAESLQVLAISVFRKTGGEKAPELIHGYQSLAGIAADLNRSAEAESLYRQSLIIAQARYPDDHPEVAGALGKLSEYANVLGSGRMADSLAVEALGMERRMWGERHPRIAEALARLSNYRIDQGRLAEAESLMTQAYRIDMEVYDEGSVGTAGAFSSLGYVQWSIGKNVEAEKNYRSAISILRKQGAETWSLGMALNDLAMVLHDLGKHDEAFQMQLEALGIFKRVWGPRHTHVGMCNSNIGVYLMYQGRYEEAVPYLKEAIAVWSNLYGPNHPLIATVENNYGYMLHGLDRLPEAEAEYRRATAAYSALNAQSWGISQLLCFANLGICLYHEGHLSEAEEVLRKTDKEFRASVGERTSFYPWMLTHFGSVLVDLGRFQEGDSLLVSCLKFYNPKTDRLWIAWTRIALASSKARQGQEAVADSLFRLADNRAWTDPGMIAADKRIARQRAERYSSHPRTSSRPMQRL